jgi:hypothetical protein
MTIYIVMVTDYPPTPGDSVEYYLGPLFDSFDAASRWIDKEEAFAKTEQGMILHGNWTRAHTIHERDVWS